MTAGDFLTVWIGVSSYLDADGVRHDNPRHLIGVSTPYVRDECGTPSTPGPRRPRGAEVTIRIPLPLFDGPAE